MLVSGGKTVKSFAVVTINIPTGDFKAEIATKVSEKGVTAFVLCYEIEKDVKNTLADFSGANHKPIFELGEQMSKARTITSSARVKVTIQTLRLI